MARPEPSSGQSRGSVFDSLPDGVLIVDLEGRITYVNHQLAALAGYRPDELVGRPVEELVPEAARDLHRAHRASYVDAGMPSRPMGTNLRIRLLTRLHEEVPVDIALRPVETDDGTRVLAAVREAAERIRAQERIEALLEIAQHILASDPTDEVLALIARRARHLVGADVATVSVPDPDSEEMVVEVADGLAEDELRGSRLPIDSSLSGQVFSTGSTRVVEGPEDVDFERYLLGSMGFGPSIVVALATGETVFGIISVAKLAGREPFNPHDLQVVELFASQAAVALENARVRDELRKLAVLEDRERIGRELHDGVIQSLFAVGMKLQASALIAGPGEVQERLEQSVTELDRAIRDLRNYIFGLRPGLLADRQLGPAIVQLAADTEEKSDITVAVDVDPQVAARVSGLAPDLIQLVRESLSNVARHSGAATCRVSLLRVDGTARLVIEDDGHGFDLASRPAGQGLGNLRDRAARIGAELMISSAAGEGTRVELALPL